MKKMTLVICAAIMSTATFAGCAGAAADPETAATVKIDEGVDTKTEVTGYKDMTGKYTSNG